MVYNIEDLIAGNEVTIQLSEPVNNIEESDLEISRVVHGYKNMFSSDVGIAPASAVYSCYNSIIGYPAWANESDAVALVIINSGTSLCTGSLLNNTAQDYRPYFLSAFHCIDISPRDGFISAAEQSVAENWAFRFQYKTADASTYITYNQAYFRAAWFNSDFALMELRQSINDNRITFLGWNRAETVTGSTTCIHHPGGDLMKISFDNNQPIVESSANTYLSINFTNGGAEEGSSGAPLFDLNKHIIGQLHGGSGNGGCPPIKVNFGRFYNSWTGGGTPSTQLNAWLDPLHPNNTGPMTTNTIRFPYIDGQISVCPYANVTYSVVGNPGNYPVTWSVSSPSIFTLLSASGNSATFRMTGTTPSTERISAYFAGITINKTVYVLFNSAQLGVYYANAYINDNITIIPPPTDSFNSYSWEVAQQPANGAVLNDKGSTCDVRFTQKGTYTINAYGNSGCATSSTPTYIFVYNVTSPAGSYSAVSPASMVVAYPNPVSSALNVEIKDNTATVEGNIASAAQTSTDNFKIRLYDEHGNLVHHTHSKKGHKTHFSVAHLKNGIYYLNILDEKTEKTEKQQIIVKH